MTPRAHSSTARASASPAEPGHGSASVCADGSVAATSVPRPYPADLDALFVSLPAASLTQPKPAALQAALFPETA